MPHVTTEALITCAVMFCVASLTGLSTLLRSRKQLTVRSVSSAMLGRGLFGLGTGLIWLSYYQDRPIWLPLGVSILVGLTPSLEPGDVMKILLRAFGLKVIDEGKDD